MKVRRILPATENPAPIERRAPVRAAFLSPGLLLGGAERWMITLARRCDPGVVRWVGTALTDWAQSETPLCGEMRRIMPIFGGLIWDGGRHDLTYVSRLPTAIQAAAEVLTRADVAVAWGVHDLGSLLGDFAGRVVLVSHGACEWTHNVLRSSEKGATDFVAVSEAARAPFSADVRPKVRVLHNGVEVARCVPTLNRAVVRARWGLGDSHRLIGHVGRFSPEKNPLAAAYAVRQLRGPYRAVYVGSGWRESETRSGVKEVVGSLAVFVPPMSQVGNALAALDVLVLATPSEGFSMILTEAWLAGLPTVATRVGAIPELEREYGPLVVPVPVDPTPDQLAESVETALDGRNAETVERARQVAWSHFTSVAMAKRWSDYLTEIVC